VKSTSTTGLTPRESPPLGARLQNPNEVYTEYLNRQLAA
jgi:hypothetical protein